MQRQQGVAARQQHQAQPGTAPPDEAVKRLQDTALSDQVGAVDHHRDPSRARRRRTTRTVDGDGARDSRQDRDLAGPDRREGVGLAQRLGQQAPETSGPDIDGQQREPEIRSPACSAHSLSKTDLPAPARPTPESAATRWPDRGRPPDGARHVAGRKGRNAQSKVREVRPHHPLPLPINLRCPPCARRHHRVCIIGVAVAGWPPAYEVASASFASGLQGLLVRLHLLGGNLLGPLHGRLRSWPACRLRPRRSARPGRRRAPRRSP